MSDAFLELVHVRRHRLYDELPILIQKGFNVNERYVSLSPSSLYLRTHEQGTRPLLYAYMKGDTELFKLLIKHGASLSEPYVDQTTLLEGFIVWYPRSKMTICAIESATPSMLTKTSPYSAHGFGECTPMHRIICVKDIDASLVTAMLNIYGEDMDCFDDTASVRCTNSHMDWIQTAYYYGESSSIKISTVRNKLFGAFRYRQQLRLICEQELSGSGVPSVLIRLIHDFMYDEVRKREMYSRVLELDSHVNHNASITSQYIVSPDEW
jgi:hypothetical protein